MNAWTLGVDPGGDGAAVLLDGGGRVVAVALWANKGEKGNPLFTLKVATPTDGLVSRYVELPAASAVGSIVSMELREITGRDLWALAVEDLHFGKGKGIQSVLTYARRTGAMIGPLERNAHGGRAAWVQPMAWRTMILGTATNAKTPEVKAASLRLMPARLPGLRPILEQVGEKHHITDAGGIAQWMRATEGR